MVTAFRALQARGSILDDDDDDEGEASGACAPIGWWQNRQELDRGKDVHLVLG